MCKCQKLEKCTCSFGPKPIPKMKPGAKKLWLKALRSRKYKQGTGQLCRSKYPPFGDSPRNVTETKGYAFCCLGVLEHVLTGKVHRGGSANLTSHVCRLAGLSEAYIPKGETIQRTLANMNDYTPMKFGGIAKWIEKNL